MPFVITEPCVGVKDAACLDVCPVDCIALSEEDEMYLINPGTCIDCSYCESVCPVNAIYDQFTVPVKWRVYIRKNREFFNGR
jgi:NAD-dependent dihydropyrimidine dehydrogenase PreA subunit